MTFCAAGSHSRKNSSTALKLGRSPSPTPSLESKEEKPPMSPADEEQDRQDRYETSNSRRSSLLMCSEEINHFSGNN